MDNNTIYNWNVYRIGCLSRAGYQAVAKTCKKMGGKTIYHGASSDGYDISIAALDVKLLEKICHEIGVRFYKDNVYLFASSLAGLD